MSSLGFFGLAANKQPAIVSDSSNQIPALGWPRLPKEAPGKPHYFAEIPVISSSPSVVVDIQPTVRIPMSGWGARSTSPKSPTRESKMPLRSSVTTGSGH